LVLALPLISRIEIALAQDLEKVVIGHSSMRNDIAFLWVPQQVGIFRKNGLDPTIVFISGGVRMTQAIVAGSAVAGSVGATLVTTAVAGGADAVMIMGITNRLTYDVWAKPEIKRPEDLKNKTLAISNFGSSSHLASFLMLKYFGLDEKRDGIRERDGVSNRFYMWRRKVPGGAAGLQKRSVLLKQLEREPGV